jgi:hypothetical protein
MLLIATGRDGGQKQECEKMHYHILTVTISLPATLISSYLAPASPTKIPGPIGSTPIAETKKDWRCDHLATRIDLRMPNEVDDRVVKMVIAVKIYLRVSSGDRLEIYFF